MKIIGLHGKIGSGKSTTQRYISSKYGYAMLNFADHLKDIISTVFLLPRDMLEGDTLQSREWRESPLLKWSEQLSDTPLGIACGTVTPRKLMQHFSDVLKTSLGVNYFVNVIDAMIMQHKQNGCCVVIGDVRYPYEEELIHRLGGVVWLIERPNIGSNETHSSETQMINCDKKIINDNTIESLYETIDKYMDI